MPTLTHFKPTDPLEDMLAALDSDGGFIVDNALESDLINTIIDELGALYLQGSRRAEMNLPATRPKELAP